MMSWIFPSPGSNEVGTSRCDVPARAERAERTRKGVRGVHCAAERGADGAARRPYRP